MLVHRIVMIHVELHHRDDLAEFGNEAAEHAGLVHPAQDQRRIALARVRIDMKRRLASSFSRRSLSIRLERARDAFQRIGMEFQPVDIGNMEQADDVDRIALEHVGAGERDAAAILDEIDACRGSCGCDGQSG